MKIIYYLKLIRIQNIFIACLAVILSSYLLHIYFVNKILVCLGLVFFSMSFANSMNDILDFKSDKKNHPNRVLIRYFISKQEAIIVCFISFFLSVLISLLLHNFNEKVFFYVIIFIHKLLLFYF